MAINNLTFEARLGGDSECFCFYVNTDTFIFLKGRERYLQELAYMHEAHNEINADVPFVEPTEWAVYPSDLFQYQKDKKYIVSFGIIEKTKFI
jgi:hypothetical protein